MNGQTVDRWIFVETQLMQIHILIEGKKWTLAGLPADQPAETDEVVSDQISLFKIYEEYGLYKVRWDEKYILGPLDKAFGRFINSRRQRHHWVRSGVFD